MMLHRFFHIILVLSCAVATVTAQPVNNSYRVNPAGTLSNYFVSCMAIDGNGYLWVGTESGLNRIMGNWSSVVPTTDNGRNQNITSLYHHAATNLILIGVENGLCVYDYKHEQMRRLGEAEGVFNNTIDDIATASDGGVWLIYGNGHIQHLDCNTMKASNQKLPEFHGNRCGMDDGLGHLYIGYSQNGMAILDLKTNKLTYHTHQAGNNKSLPGNNVRCIMSDSNGRIWVGTDRGMALFNPVDGTFTKVTQTTDNYDDNVYEIRQMNDGTLWVATDMGGMLVLDLKNVHPGSPLHFTPVHIETSSINVRSIVQDEFGNIWLGNHSTGVDFISARKSLFHVIETPPVFDIASDDGQRLWLGCENELSVWEEGKQSTRWTLESMAHREHSFPRCILTDKDGYVWLGMEDEGVVRFDPRSRRFQRIDIGHETSDVHAFAQDATGRIWIGAEIGVFSYADGKVTAEEDISQAIMKAPVTDFLWLSTEDVFMTTLGKGACLMNLRTRQFVTLRTENGLPTDKINQVITDRKQGVWMATSEGLVHLKDPLQMKGITLYDQNNGLADNHIRALQQDADGRIWVSTFSGISCLNNENGVFHNYDYFDDQKLNGFASGAVVTTTDGTLCFGAINGLCTFNPKDFNDPPKVSDVQIVNCLAYNPVGSDTEILSLTADEDGRVYTTYQQNTVRLTFTLRNHAQTGNEEYSYMMKGMDNKWYYIDDDHDVVFRGLRPGHYTFNLRAKLKSQDWKDASVTQLEIRISPPLWRTWWAYILYALALALWGWYAARSYKRKLALRTSLEIERHESMQKQELNEERLRFFTNITHELRTPLTLILGPLEDLAEDPELPQQSRRRVTLIQKSAERLRSLITEILEFRKTETQNRRLTVAKGDIGQFISEIFLNYKELNSNKNLQFVLEIADDLPQVYFDSEIITTVLNNFLSNAIKYTEQGSITTRVRRKGNSLKISVSDTGYGIAPDALPHVFDRYYQAKGSHQASGTGIGLALVKSLARLHEAEVDVDSHEGEGSCFTLTLDIDNKYPEALHKEDNTPSPQKGEEVRLADEERDEMAEEAQDVAPTLLIIEDNTDIRQYIADSFADDYRILQAENGEQGLQVALENIPDIIVSDIMMPRLNGIQLTRQLKNDIRTSHIPIILLTAKTTDEDKEEGYDSGADSYLTKPFTAKLLAKRIQNLLTARRRLAELINSRMKTKDGEPVKKVTLPVTQLSSLDNEFLNKVDAVINEHIMVKDIDIAFITDQMAMSHSTFYRKIKALTGLTAMEYIRKLKLQHCYLLLESGNYNVNEAAMMTGFNQMSHFRETFKKEFGVLPSDVIKKKTNQK